MQAKNIIVCRDGTISSYSNQDHVADVLELNVQVPTGCRYFLVPLQ